jgi:hypothetical protein
MSHPQPQARESSGPAFPIDCARPADPRAGHPDGSWTVNTPVEEVPPELPEPVLGINFARDGQQRHKACLGGSHSVAAARAAALRRAALLPSRPPPRKPPAAGMDRKDWLSLCAVHSDAWLMSVLFFYAARYDDVGRCVRPPSCLPARLPPHARPPACLPACLLPHPPPSDLLPIASLLERLSGLSSSLWLTSTRLCTRSSPGAPVAPRSTSARSWSGARSSRPWRPPHTRSSCRRNTYPAFCPASQRPRTSRSRPAAC